MAGCSDSRFEKMLHAYELGMLTDDERQEFELHIYECDHCFERVRKFRDAAELIKHNPKVESSIREFANEDGTVSAPGDDERVQPERKRLWRTLIPTLAAAAILIFLLVRPWQVRISMEQDAIAAENRLAVMYFENVANPEDPQRLGEITANLLVTDLSESHYIQMISSQRMYDVLRMLGKEDVAAVDKDLATQVAQRAGARWTLMGSILQEEPSLIVTSQIVETATGEVVESQRVEGDSTENIFALIDRLTVEIKADLGLPEEALKEPDRNVADVTTHSPEAYRYYVEGTELVAKFYTAEAVEKFEKALEYDSTFAMAYYSLAITKDRSYATKAVEYIDHAGQKDRFYIRYLEASLAGNFDEAMNQLEMLLERFPDEKTALVALGRQKSAVGHRKEAIELYHRAIEADSLFGTAYNQLAYAYSQVDDIDRALWASNEYIRLAPDEPNPYDTRGDILSAHGQLRKAIESYQKALEIKPDFSHALQRLGMLYVFEGDFIRADSCLRLLLEFKSRGARGTGWYYIAALPVYQGKFREALKAIDTAENRVREIFGRDVYRSFHIQRSFVHGQLGFFDSSLIDVANSYDMLRRDNPGRDPGMRPIEIQYTAEGGDIAGAREKAEELRRGLDATGAHIADYYYSLGYVEWVLGNADSARVLFEKSMADTNYVTFDSRYMLGVAALESGRLGTAVREFEAIITNYSDARLSYAIWGVKSHYHLAKAYEASGWNDEAIEQYQTFLHIWRDADAGIFEVEDARERLTRLQSGS